MEDNENHKQLYNQVMQNTNNIGSMKADIAVVRTNTEWIKDSVTEMKHSFSTAISKIEARDAVVAVDLAQKEKKTWEKLADIGVIKLLVFGAAGVILSTTILSITLIAFSKLGLMA